MEHTNFAQIARINAKCDGFSDISGQRRGDITESLKADSVPANLAHLRHMDQQKIQLLQRVRHPWQEAVSLPALSRRYLRFGAFATVIYIKQKITKAVVELGQR